MADYEDILRNVKDASSPRYNSQEKNTVSTADGSKYNNFYKEANNTTSRTQPVSNADSDTKKSDKLPWIIAAVLGIALVISSAFFMTKVTQLTQDREELVTELAKVKNKNNELVENSRNYNKIIKILSNNNPTNNYFAKEYFVVVKVGETKTIPITSYYSNTTINFNGTNTSTTADWNYYWNGATTSWLVTGNSPGTDNYDFWVDGRDDAFSICVVVTK